MSPTIMGAPHGGRATSYVRRHGNVPLARSPCLPAATLVIIVVTRLVHARALRVLGSH